jgi:hypothetical protein
MKLRDLIKKIEGNVPININGKLQINESDDILDVEVLKIDVVAKKEDLKSLGYSFEVGI